jgi:hypothetical protein
MPAPVIVSAAVEGIVDEAVVQRLIVHAGGVPGSVYGKRGKAALRTGIGGFNHAAGRAPWLVLVDLDRQYECAPPLVGDWVPGIAPHMCFRVAVRAVEAWLLADHEKLAGFLRIAVNRVPRQPEALCDPKQTLVELARRSRSRDIREDMVPRERSGRTIGPAYASRIIEYVQEEWRPDVAARRAASLERAIASLKELIGRTRRNTIQGNSLP